MILDYDFYDKVEKRLDHVIYGDTDSLFINLPNTKIDYNNLQDSYNKIKDISEGVNDKLTEYLTSNVFNKLGIDPEYNRTSFKTEIISDAIMFTGQKKTYAFRMIAKEWNEVKHKPIEYTGSTTKSDVIAYTKQIINHLVENILFNTEYTPQQKTDLANAYIIEFRQKIMNDINSLNVENIGTPKKWGTKGKSNDDTWQIYGMRLYNTITDTMIFKPMLSGYALPIIITNSMEFIERIKDVRFKSNLYIGDAPLGKFSNIVFPHTFNKEVAKEAMEKYFIKIDFDKVWGKVLSKSLKDILAVFKQNSNPINQLIGKIK